MFDIKTGWCSRLASSDVPAASEQPGWLIDSLVDKAFVEPTLRVVHGDPTSSQIIVVAAPGAVGKSTLARAISMYSKSVLVDLAKTEPLGGNFFVGGIANAFGYQALADVASGKLGLIVDALDEAQLRAGDEGFEAGLLDLAKIVKSGNALPATLLGRATAADAAYVYLDDAGLEPCLLSIDYFDEVQSQEFIQRRMAALADERSTTRLAFVKHSASFNELALATRSKLMETPGGNDQRFAGYAPVLDAICTYALGDDADLNPSTRTASLQAESAIGLIGEIALSILQREQAKLTSQLGQVDHPAGLNLQELYTPQEQLALLSSRLFGTEPPLNAKFDDPDFKRTYDSMVTEFLPQHPFLDTRGNPSNAAFAAFMLVWSITRGNSPQQARRQLALKPNLGSGLFFEMYMQWLYNSEDNKLDLEDLGSLYHSFASQAVQGDRPTLEVAAEVGDGNVEVEFEMHRQSSDRLDSLDSRQYGPFVTSINGILEFRNPVGGLIISGPLSVIIGDGRLATLTAPIDLDVEMLEIDAKELRVFRSAASDEQGPGRVSLTALDASVERVERIVLHGAQLLASLPATRAHPWADYIVQAPSAPNDRIESLRRRARKVLTSFRSHSKGALVRYAAKIEHTRMLKEGSEGPQLLEKLLDDGILSKFDVGKFYQLHPDRLAQHFNMDYQAIHLQRWTDEADAYLSSVGQRRN